MQFSAIIFLALTLAAASSQNCSVKNYLRDIPDSTMKGLKAKNGQFPYLIGIHFSWGRPNCCWKCAGALIGARWVLTAAHCTHNATFAEVFLGALSFYEPAIAYMARKEDIIQHEGFNYRRSNNDDIALIRIQNFPQLPEFTRKIHEIQLPTKAESYDDYNDENVIIAGWGNFTKSNTLIYKEMKVISNEVCNKIYDDITLKKICLTADNGENACKGDSGSPMVLEKSKIVIGIASYGSDCCKDGAPLVYTRVTSYLDWITEKTGIRL